MERFDTKKNVHFLKSKEIRLLVRKINEIYDVDLTNYFSDKIINISKDGKIYLINQDFLNIDINYEFRGSVGLYFAKQESDGIRLSIEGAQVCSDSKNYINLNDEQTEKYFLGEEIYLDKNPKLKSSYCIIKNNSKIIGCDLLKGNILQNHIQKQKIGTTLV